MGNYQFLPHLGKGGEIGRIDKIFHLKAFEDSLSLNEDKLRNSSREVMLINNHARGQESPQN